MLKERNNHLWGNYLTFKIKRENDSSMQRTFSLVLGFEKNLVESVCDKKEGKKERSQERDNEWRLQIKDRILCRTE